MLADTAIDGDFARLMLRKVASDWAPKVVECVRAAVKVGEAVGGPVPPGRGAWFTQHVAGMIALYALPAVPVVEYGASRDRLVEQAVWFALRGLGLKEEAIQRYYSPNALALFGD